MTIFPVTDKTKEEISESLTVHIPDHDQSPTDETTLSCTSVHICNSPPHHMYNTAD